MDTVNLLFSVDDGYIDQLKVTLYSVLTNSSCRDVQVYILQKELLARDAEIRDFCAKLGVGYTPIVIGDTIFREAPTTNRYPETIYYRLLAHQYLPEQLDRILYLDADILCINDIMPLYQMELGDELYAAASHTNSSMIAESVNKIRLGGYESEAYFNSGVLLMNLTEIRKSVDHREIHDYIGAMGNRLFLPDQDVLTALYGHLIAEIPDEIYNFDARYHYLYFAKSAGTYDLDWIVAHTVFLHFCGRDKPWKKNHRGVFASLYKHYQQRTKIF